MIKKIKQFLGSTPMKMSAGSVGILLGFLVYASIIAHVFLVPATMMLEPDSAGCGSALTFSESYDHQEQDYDVEVLWTSESTVEKIVLVDDSDGKMAGEMSEVGETATASDVESGEEVIVVGVLEDGSRQVVQSYTVGE